MICRSLRQLAFIFFLLSTATYADTSPHWQWQDNFSAFEKKKLISWIELNQAGIERLFGHLPFTYHVYFHRSDGGKGPAPWAHTDKTNVPSVHYYVNAAQYSLTEFNRDWTASHELSHLLFPYLGPKGMWFSEGIASYLQYQIMFASDTLSWQEVVSKLKERFNAVRRYKQYDSLSINELNQVIFRSGHFPRLYWSGAAYFLKVDRRLFDEKKLRLNDVIKKYLICCYKNNFTSVEKMVQKFDRISDSNIFSLLYDEIQEQKGFPVIGNNLNWLLHYPPRLVH